MLLHLDETATLARDGIRPALIFAGAAKADGSRLAALEPARPGAPAGARRRLHALFMVSIAEHRGLSEQMVRTTAAGLYMGAAAVKAWLADKPGDRAAAMTLLRTLGPASGGAAGC